MTITNIPGMRIIPHRDLTPKKARALTDRIKSKMGDLMSDIAKAWIGRAHAALGYDTWGDYIKEVTEDDINEAFDCAAHGGGAHCVMAQAGQRLGAKSVYFYRTTAWVDFGTGPILRYITSKTIYDNIIKPFDKGDRKHVASGHYPLIPPTHSKSLKERRKYEKTHRRNPGMKQKMVAHTDRVVMASQASTK